MITSLLIALTLAQPKAEPLDASAFRDKLMVLTDEQGLILATKNGNLRLVTSSDGKFEGRWIQGKVTTPLVEVSLDSLNNSKMVYMDLGPYSGQRLGTPCDDFM